MLESPTNWTAFFRVPGGGFSYQPSEFTDRGVTYSNPAWEDLGVPSFELMETVVRQAREIMKSGGKIAVHCHAGMGRTGLVITSIMGAEGTDPADALKIVRAKRPGMVQSDPQEEFLHRFKDYLESRGLRGKL